MNKINQKKEIKTEVLNKSLVGLSIFIQNHSNPSFVRISGIVEDETKNMLVIKTEKNRILKVSKLTGTFEIVFKDTKVSIEGSILIGNAKSRAKKRFRNW